jgi:alkylated DNA nucleotide flippase Atl1
VAYLLSRLAADERAELPWHRVVGAGGALASGERGAEQRARLVDDGVSILRDGRVDLDVHGVRLLLDEQHRASPSTPLERSPG